MFITCLLLALHYGMWLVSCSALFKLIRWRPYCLHMGPAGPLVFRITYYCLRLSCISVLFAYSMLTSHLLYMWYIYQFVLYASKLYAYINNDCIWCHCSTVWILLICCTLLLMFIFSSFRYCSLVALSGFFDVVKVFNTLSMHCFKVYPLTYLNIFFISYWSYKA